MIMGMAEADQNEAEAYSLDSLLREVLDRRCDE